MEAKFIPDEKAIRLIEKVIEAVRNNPQQPRAIYTDGKSTVYMIHESLYNMLAAAFHAPSSSPPPQPEMVHASCWKEVNPGESIVEALDKPSSILGV